MPRRLAALAALCAAGAVPARGAAAEPPAHVGSSGGGAAAPEAGRRWSVPFSLRDAGGRDLVAEAAALRRSGGGRRLMAELGPAPPLELNFTAQGVRFSLELHRAGPVFTPRARIVNGRGEAVPQHRVTAQPIFRSEKHGAVLSPVDGGLRGLVRMGGSLLDVEADPSTGTLAIAGEALAMERAAGFTADEGEWMPDLHGSARIFDPGAVERWTNCYTDDHITRALSMGVSIGSTLMARFTGAEDATEWLQSVFAMANMIYTPQLNFVLMIDQVYIPTLVGEHPGWTDCSGIAGQLDSLASWDQPSRQGLWHLFDDCWVSGTIGLANRGDTSSNGMCQIDKVGASHTNVGVTWVSADTWLTFAHEVGHNFGADHAFENGQGTTGGIMDYGDGKHEGIYQFNTASTKDDICPVVAYRVDQGCEAISNFFAECGNEVVEEGEECECAGGATSCSFCSGCVLHAGKECTPDAPDGQCCNCDGSFKSSYHTCALMADSTGYCDRGGCVATFCSGGGFGAGVGDFCGLHPNNECKVQCISTSSGACTPMFGWAGSDGQALNTMDDGSPCNGGQGVCQSGVCSTVPAPTPTGCVEEYYASGQWVTCDEAWEIYTYTCDVLEKSYAWDCAGCACPGENWAAPTPSPVTCDPTPAPPPTPAPTPEPTPAPTQFVLYCLPYMDEFQNPYYDDRVNNGLPVLATGCETYAVDYVNQWGELSTSHDWCELDFWDGRLAEDVCEECGKCQDTPEPTPAPTPSPTPLSTPTPTLAPTAAPSPAPTPAPAPAQTPAPTPAPTAAPTPTPTPAPTPAPTASPSSSPPAVTPAPSAPTPAPTLAPIPSPTPAPTAASTPTPSLAPTPAPTPSPTPASTPTPTPAPTAAPSPAPTPAPAPAPTPAPTLASTPAPTAVSTPTPTPAPTPAPTAAPSSSPPAATPAPSAPTPSPTPLPTTTPAPTSPFAPNPAPTPATASSQTPAPTPAPAPASTATPTSAPTPSPTPASSTTAVLKPSRIAGSMKLSFGDNAAAVEDPQVKLGVERGIAVRSGLGEENADMVEATLSLVSSRRLAAAVRWLSGYSVQVDFEINIPSEVSASIDAYDVAESLASADEDSLADALSDAITSVADAGYAVEVVNLPSVGPVVVLTPAPTTQPTPTPTAAPIYSKVRDAGRCDGPAYAFTVGSVEECAVLCSADVVVCLYFSYSSGTCLLTDNCDEVAAAPDYSVYQISSGRNGVASEAISGVHLQKTTSALIRLAAFFLSVATSRAACR